MGFQKYSKIPIADRFFSACGAIRLKIRVSPAVVARVNSICSCRHRNEAFKPQSSNLHALGVFICENNYRRFLSQTEH
jgi:hypothetical protein